MHKNTYAQKYFKPMTPGDAFGEGFIGQISKYKKEKTKSRALPSMKDVWE